MGHEPGLFFLIPNFWLIKLSLSSRFPINFKWMSPLETMCRFKMLACVLIGPNVTKGDKHNTHQQPLMLWFHEGYDNSSREILLSVSLYFNLKLENFRCLTCTPPLSSSVIFYGGLQIWNMALYIQSTQ